MIKLYKEGTQPLWGILYGWTLAQVRALAFVCLHVDVSLPLPRWEPHVTAGEVTSHLQGSLSNRMGFRFISVGLEDGGDARGGVPRGLRGGQGARRENCVGGPTRSGPDPLLI